MHAGEWIALAAIAVVALGGIFGIIRWFAIRDRQRVDIEAAAMWKRIDEMKKQLDAAQEDLIRLQERATNHPTKQDIWDLEQRVQQRLERLTKEFGEMLKSARFICPNVAKVPE